ncbi:MAG: hypothetical protein ACM3X5_05245, partial [Bacillota bacterium]
MNLSRIAAATFLVLLSLVVADASAQFPHRERMGSPRDTARERETPRNAVPTGTDPYGALERELPSLNVDLQIRAEQLEEWRRFERGVRDLAEMERSRRRHLLALGDAAATPPTAATLVASLAEDDRLQAEAAGELKRRLESLYAKLDDKQRQMLDRRVVQSQVEPLGGASRSR